jgi:HupE / UreJ protein
MKIFIQIWPWILSVVLASHLVHAHQEPTSFLELHFQNDGLRAELVTSIADLAHELDDVEPQMLLNPATLMQHENRLVSILSSRFYLKVDGVKLAANSVTTAIIPEREDIRFEFQYDVPSRLREFSLGCKLFPYDTRHRTYVNCYHGKSLLRQEVLVGDLTSLNVPISDRQSIWKVIGDFTYEGARHIFIGPDHILFVIGLLLLGGSLGCLLRIITGFTIAHSITLCLATFQIVSPPASIVEPVIALSIVVVGLHSLFGSEVRGPRLWFAFTFGLIHGFGFASVLQEMELPRHALGLSLFSFNLGVELGQTCIILLVAPLLAVARKCNPSVAGLVTHVSAFSIITAGAFWFFQRVM